MSAMIGGFPKRRSLLLLLLIVSVQASQAGGQVKTDRRETARTPKLGTDDLTALGIRRLEGRHLTLFTDLPPTPSVDELPQVFDRAVPQWCTYFEIAEPATQGWKNIGCVMQDKDKFARAGLLPQNLPPFLHGYQQGTQLWLHEQPSDYYRRHLLLHEGTHAFMHAFLGGAGPPWYMEGMAELLATHRQNGGDVVLRSFPRSKADVPEWGRIKIVKDDIRAGQGKTLREIMMYDTRAHLQVNPYGWCWAACAFLDAHPVCQKHFRRLKQFAAETDHAFSQRLIGWFDKDWQRVERDWQVFVTTIEYGFDIQREAIRDRGQSLITTTAGEGKIDVDCGWQATGVSLESGKKYRIVAEGRYQLGTMPKIWWCEPDGVTIRYHGGRPLGMVLAAIAGSDRRTDTVGGFLEPIPVGSSREIIVERGGMLYLRINDHPAELSDNRGEIQIRIREAP